MKKVFLSILFCTVFSVAVLSQDFAETLQWRIQGVDTLPSWVISYDRSGVELGVSDAGLNIALAQDQAVAHALLCHLLHSGLDTQCVEETFSSSTSGEDFRSEVRRLVKAVINYRFDYKVLNEYVSNFGEVFREVEISPDPDGKCLVKGVMELFYSYKFTGTDRWSGYYQLALRVDGLDSLSEMSMKMHRLQRQSEYHSQVNGISTDKDLLYCTYADCGDSLVFEHYPMRRLVKGFWPSYILSHFDCLFFEDSDNATIKSVTENYNGSMKNIDRNISEKLRIKVDTEIRGIADNYLHVQCRLQQEKTADENTPVTHDVFGGK